MTSTAFAHARYKSSTPAKGEVLAESAPRVVIVFSQDIQKVTGSFDIEVTNEGETAVTSGPSAVDEADRSKLSVPLTAGLPLGRYVVHWNNVSDDDGDPAEGAFSFYVGRSPTAAELQQDTGLEAVGAEDETPEASQTAAGSTATATNPIATPTPGKVRSSDGGGNTRLYVVVGVAAAIVLVAAGGAIVFRMRAR